MVMTPLLASCRAGATGPASATGPAATTGPLTTTGPAATTGPTGAAPPIGGSSQTITVDGTKREFRLYRPAATRTADAASLALVVMLHGGFGSASQAESYYGWDAEADAHDFVAVYPDGLNRAWNVGGGCCGKPAERGVDDVGFISAVVRAVLAELPVDPDRVYATGISNGGMMAYRLACDTSLFAAIGPDSATLLGPCPAPRPLSVIHIHGTADTRIRYNGGLGNGQAKIDGPPVPTVIADWRTIDDCAAPTTTTQPATPTAGAVTTAIATCPSGRAIELITIDGAGHQWPGSPSRRLSQKLLDLDPPSTALNATDVIWRFFAAHPRPTR
jgi:polyhydroxybutyrate depolymerase